MDTRKPYSDSVSPYILLHQVRRDTAIGMPRAGTRLRALIDYCRQREREATKSLAGAALLKAIVEECHKDVKQLMAVADTPDKRRAILDKVQDLHTLAERAAAELEKMTYAE